MTAPPRRHPSQEPFIDRNLRVAGIAMLAMMCLGMAAFWMGFPVLMAGAGGFELFAEGGSGLLLLLLGTLLSAFTGAPVGGVSIPIVMFSIRRKDLRVAVPLVYGGSLLVIAVYIALDPFGFAEIVPIDAAIPAFISVCVLSVICRFALPDRVILGNPLECPRCQYDLRGAREPGCPECGWGRKRSGAGTRGSDSEDRGSDSGGRGSGSSEGPTTEGS